jgi:hypothetical protein
MADMKATVGVIASGVAVACVALWPATAAAQHRGQGHHSIGRDNVGSRGFGHSGIHRHPGGARLIVVAPFFPFGYYSSAFAYSSPMDYAPPPAYGPPPMYSGPPAYAPPVSATYAPSPPPQPPLQQDVDPTPRDVVFPSGRYVLRGDGITTPYTWVWIPNPPTAPPGGATPGSSARDAERAIYAWTDGNGLTTWTDRLSRVPPEYRATARRDF